MFARRLITSCFAALIALPVAAQQQPEPADYTAAYVVEPTTWTVLYEKNGQQPLPIASMTKMMTLLLTVEEVYDRDIKWQDPVRVSAEASVLGGSQVYLRHNEVFSVAELAAATMVHSANDAAQALAEKIGGSREAFVVMMNDRAQELGLKNTTYVSPHGLPQGAGQPNDVMSPEDLARLGWELMKYPNMRDWAMRKTMPFRNGTFTMYNPNRLVRNDFPGIIGIKTGYHDAAGFCVTAAARRDGMTVIAVVMGAPSSRALETATGRLINEAFAQWDFVEPVKKGQPIQGEVPIVDGAVDTVPVLAGASARFVVRESDEPKFDMRVAGINAKAPIEKGARVGTIVLSRDGQPVASIPAVAATSVDKVGWWKAFWPF